MRSLLRVAWLLTASVPAVVAAPGASLTVVLTAPDNAPAVGVAVSVWVDHKPHEAVSNSAGRARFEGLPEGHCSVSAREALFGRSYQDTELHAGSNEVRMVLTPRGDAPGLARVEVLVIGLDGRPAANNEVEVDTRNDGPPPAPPARWLGGLALRYEDSFLKQSGIMMTDAQGRIRFEAPPGRLSVCVTARHHLGEGRECWAPPGRTTYVRANLADAQPITKEDEPERPVKPASTARLRARLLDAAGHPMAHQPLVVRPQDPPSHWWYSSKDGAIAVTTDGQGRFDLDWPEEEGQARVKVPGWSVSAPFEAAGPTGASIDVRLELPALAAAGLVVDDRGQPAPGVAVWALPGRADRMDPPAEESRWLPAEPPEHLVRLAAGPGYVTRTDEHGRFRFDQLDQVSYCLLASSTAHVQSAMVECRRDSMSTDLRLTVERACALSGRVLRPDGRPWSNCPLTVRVNDQDSSCLPPVDLQGRWQMGGLAPGRQRLTIQLPGCEDVVRDVSPRPAETVDLTLRGTACQLLRGQVLLANGQPARDVRLVWPAPGHENASPFFNEQHVAWTDADGRFCLAGLRRGEHEVGIEVASGQEAPVTVTMPRAEPLTLRLPWRGTLAGRVVDAEGQPVAGAYCMASRCSYPSQSDPDGRFEIGHLKAGDYTLEAWSESRLLARTQVRLPVGQERVELLLKPGPVCTVRGRVFGADGRPMASIRVQVGREMALTDDHGAYSVDTEETGPLQVLVWRRGAFVETVRVAARLGHVVTAPDLRVSRALVKGRLLAPAGMSLKDCNIDRRTLALDAQGRLVPDTEAVLLPGSHADNDAPWQHGRTLLIGCDLGALAYPTAHQIRPPPVHDPTAWVPAASVGEDGNFTMVTEPGWLHLVVTGPAGPARSWGTALLASQMILVPTAGLTDLQVPLVRGSGELHGRLRAEERSEVVAYRDGSWTLAARTSTTDGGFWRLPGLAAGAYRLALPGGSAGRWHLLRVTVTDGQSLPVPEPAPAAHAVAGRVTGTRPADLRLTVESDTLVASQPVAPDGRFSFEHLPAGQYRFTLWSSQLQRLLRLPEPRAVPGPEVEMAW